jgi:hypothetical protein
MTAARFRRASYGPSRDDMQTNIHPDCDHLYDIIAKRMQTRARGSRSRDGASHRAGRLAGHGSGDPACADRSRTWCITTTMT